MKKEIPKTVAKIKSLKSLYSTCLKSRLKLEDIIKHSEVWRDKRLIIETLIEIKILTDVPFGGTLLGEIIVFFRYQLYQSKTKKTHKYFKDKMDKIKVMIDKLAIQESIVLSKLETLYSQL